MNELRNANLIEHILSLLSVPEKYNIDCLLQKTEQANLPVSFDAQNLQTAYDIINFMDEMPGGFLIYHAKEEEKIIYANKALLRIFRCDTWEEFQELTGNSFKGMVYPEDIDIVEKSIKEQITNSQYDLDYVEYRIMRKDGTIGWIEDYGHFIHSKSVGDIFYVFMADVTEKKFHQLTEKAILMEEKKQKELKIQSLMEEYDKERKIINQEHLRRLEVIEGLSVNYECILYADLDTDKVFPYRLSSRTEHQFKKKFQVRGFLWYVFDYVNVWVHPEDREIVSRATAPEYIREKLSNNKTYYINYRIVNHGEIQYLQLRIVNVGNKNRISQIVMGYRRVDEEVRREMEQKQIFEDALNNANLAITAKNTFLSNMSHDLRTPLNAIFGFTALAKKNINHPEIVENYLNKIENSSHQLLELIEKVLEISWSESNDIRITEAECNLLTIIQNVYHALLPQAEEKDITFFLQSELEHCDIYSDQDKLRQLLLYLANNAITYTKSGGKVIMTVIELEKLPNDYVTYQFVVEDTGIGIGKDFLEHIFEPFEREKNTTFSGIHGSGLGLTIAKNITEMMGGHIEVDSTVGKGSKFTITLRFRLQEHPTLCSSEDSIANLLNKKILLVEDNPTNLEIETEILQGLGFVIEPATDGSIAVEKIKQSDTGAYDLILMDIQMPVMNGWEAAKSIRELENSNLANIPIIALSADAFESDKRMSKESGMDAHLTKPIDIPLLLETIAKTLKTRKTLGDISS